MLAALYWQNPQAWPWAAAVAAGGAAWAAWAYRPQVRGRRAAVRWGLPGTRVAAVFVLAVSVLQPVVRRPRTGAEVGPVVVLLDASASMGVADAGRSVGQWVAVAAALGRVAEGARDPAVRAVQADADQLSALADDVVRSRDELRFAQSLSRRSVDVAAGRYAAAVASLQSAAKAVAARAHALPRSAGLDRPLADLSAVPAGTSADGWVDHVRERARAAVAAAEQARQAADARLYRTDPAVRAACDPLFPATRAALARAAAARIAGQLASQLGSAVPVVAFAAAEDVTPVDLRTGHPTTGPVDAVVADGTVSNLTGATRAVLDHFAADPPRAIVLLSDGREVGGGPGPVPAGVPVYTVGVGSRQPVKDVAVTDLSVPRAPAYVGDPIAVTATVRTVGYPPGTDVTVTCAVGDDDPAPESRRVPLAADRATAVSFTRVATTAGVTRVAVTVAPMAGEATTANNGAERWVEVVGGKVRVAAISAVPAGWDYRFACRALAATPWVELTTATADAGRPLDVPPRELVGQDVTLLFDVPAAGLSAAQWEAVRRGVADRGGGAVLVAGPVHFRDEYPTDPAVAPLLPIAGPAALPWRAWPGPRPGFHLAAADGSDAGLSPPPAVFHYLPLSPLKPGVRAVWVEPTSELPVLTEATVGTGRVLCLGTTETWRSRSADGGAAFDALWRGLVRRAAERPYADDRGTAAVDVDPLFAGPGQPVHVRVRLTGGDGVPTVAAPARLRVAGRPDAPLVPSAGDRRYHATITDLPVGDDQLTVDAGDGFARPRVTVHVRRSTEAELADVAGDESFLRQLSDSTGGRFLRLDQIDTLPATLAAIGPDPARPVERRLWDGPYLLVVVLGLLTAEWAVRKRVGLA